MEVKNKIILALDVSDYQEAMYIVERVSNHINTIKIGYPLVLAQGLGIIDKIKEISDFQVISDFKVADIPETNKKIADLTFQAGSDGLIVHGFVGPDSVQASQKVAQEYDRKIFLLTEMSHPGAARYIQHFTKDMAQMGMDLGITHYVGPSTNLEHLADIRRIIGEKSFLISPGVGVQGGDAKRTLEYADALIIGRSIYSSSDAEQAVKSIINSIKF